MALPSIVSARNDAPGKASRPSRIRWNIPWRPCQKSIRYPPRKRPNSGRVQEAIAWRVNIRTENCKYVTLKLSEIDRLAVEQWLAAKPHLSWWTKDGLRRLLARVFTAAEEWGWFEGKKPTSGVRLGPKKLVYKKRLLAIQEFRMLLAALDEEMRFLVLILFGLGLRISEALSLKWGDIDWQVQAIALDRRWYRGDMSDFMKTEGSAATMRLSPSLLAEFARRRGKPEDLLFPGENGNPYDDRDLGRERLRPVLKRLGLYTRGNLWHQFRRMYNTYLQQAGATPLEAQKAMRHASLDMTYLYTLTDAEREVAQQQAMFDKLMEGGTKQ